MNTRKIMKKIGTCLALAAVLLSLLPVHSASAGKGVTYEVTATAVRIRQKPSTNSKILATAPHGASVTVYGTSGSFYKVTYNGHKGYAVRTALKKGGASKSTGYRDLKPGSTGAAVRKLQQRLKVLGYSVKVTGKYDTATVKAVKYYQMLKGTALTGKASAALQKEIFSGKARKYVSIRKMNFFSSSVQSMFPRDSRAYIVDVSTGTVINIYRLQGHNHFDVEPCTAKDTAKLKSLVGGQWSWNARSVILVVKGVPVAASINTYPHGKYVIKNNNFNGHFCLHTTGSKTHGSGKVNSGHQSRVNQAARFLK